MGSTRKKGHNLSNARRRRTPKAWHTGGSMTSERQRKCQIDVDHQVRRREADQIRIISSPVMA
jgi:RecB family endonuclease NucS